MRLYFPLLFWLVLVLSVGSVRAEQASSCVELPSEIQKIIKKDVEAKRGVEYCEFRDVAFGDLDSDKQRDIVVVYNIEGSCMEPEDVDSTPGACGNSVTLYMIVFLKRNHTFQTIGPTQVGARGSRYISSLKVTGNVIEAQTLEWENDPMCCPSKKGRTVFRVVSGTLKETDQ